MTINWKQYDPGECYDELISTPGYARAVARNLTSWLRGLNEEGQQTYKVEAERGDHRQGGHVHRLQ